jgi:hypothetical protein
MRDLAIIVTSMNEAQWLRALLPTIASHAGDIDFEVIIADIESEDDLAEVVASHSFARTVPVVNRGYAHANNVATLTADARYVLYLNPDTEILDGTFSALLAALEERPAVGLVGVRQLTPEGQIYPTMRRFTSPARRAAEALWSERLAPSLGRRVLDTERYSREVSCDWTIGSFMLVRSEALMSAGLMDERFFFTCEEQDLCWRIREAGWDVRHLPTMTIVHHIGKRGIDRRIAQQRAFAEMQFAHKHFSARGRFVFQGALVLNHALRTVSLQRERRRAERAALDAALGRASSPFRAPPQTALPAGTVTAARSGAAT